MNGETVSPGLEDLQKMGLRPEDMQTERSSVAGRLETVSVEKVDEKEAEQVMDATNSSELVRVRELSRVPGEKDIALVE